MTELQDIRKNILSGNLPEALRLVTELEEMGRRGLENNLSSYAVVLLLHLIKQQIENRTTRSWDISIQNAVDRINLLNGSRKTQKPVFSQAEILEILNNSLPEACRDASLEILEGALSPKEIRSRIDSSQICQKALTLIAAPNSEDE